MAEHALTLSPMVITPAALAEFLARHRYSIGTERELQDGIAQVFAGNGIDFQREYAAGANRFDFFVAGIVIEVKTGGTQAALLRQIFRYIALDTVSAVIVIGTPRWINSLPTEIQGKAVVPVRLIGSLI